MTLIEKMVYGVLFLLLGAFFLNAILIFSFPFDVRGGCEGLTLAQSIRLISGEAYTSIHSSPFQIEFYPPVFPLISSMFFLPFGKTLLAGRMVSFLASLFSATILYVLLRHLFVSKKISGAFAMAFLISNSVFHWGVLYRVDMLALFFSLVGLFYFLKDKRELSILFCVLAFFTKPTFGIASAFTCTLWLTCHQDSRSTLRYLLSFLSILAILTLLLSFVTRGQFLLHLSYQFYFPFHVKNALVDLFYFFIFHVFFFVLVFNLIIFKPTSLFSFYFLISYFILVTTIGKEGSDINYFIEPTASLMLCAAMSYQDLLMKREKQWATILWSLMFIQLLLSNPIFKGGSHVKLEQFDIPDRNKANRLFEHIQRVPSKVLVEDAEYAVYSRRTVFMSDPVCMRPLALKSKWDPAHFLSMLERKEFSLVAFYWRMDMIPGFSDYLKRNYVLIDEFDQQRGLGTVGLPHVTNGIFYPHYRWKIFKPKRSSDDLPDHQTKR